jgi:solute carrier family 25 (peroxisomal adenine nucleotide transporter), member 17
VLAGLFLALNPAVQYMVFEQMKLRWQFKGGAVRELSGLDHFLLGAFSKTIATLVTYPMITVKTRMQAKGSKYNGVIDVFLKIIEEKGILGFYSGIESKIVQSVLTSAFLFFAHQKFYSLIMYLLKLRRNKK